MASPRSPRLRTRWLAGLAALCALALTGATPLLPFAAGPEPATAAWRPFQFWADPSYSDFERFALIGTALVALGAVVYALALGRRVAAADRGTSRMQEIAAAVRDGADAYLKRQFSTLVVLILVIAAVLVAAKWPAADDPRLDEHRQIAIGRGVAFLVGAFFSAMVGFVGMRLATTGNLRVAAGARKDFGTAFGLAYRTGTVTGLLTVGLGLFGGTVIFLYFGEKAFEALLGFGFGGTLLALFMRVGGGIYTKAADVGADLVGKIEANIPEDDPRNAATIADNVGDNVGDCAGMAADVFESYMVTIVAAMILGLASFGHKGVIFPLLVMAVGVLVSIFSTSSVRAGAAGNAGTAMRSLNRGFRTGAAAAAVGFVVLGVAYLNFDGPYTIGHALERGLADEESARVILGSHFGDRAGGLLTDATRREELAAAWKALPSEEQVRLSLAKVKPGEGSPTLNQLSREFVPVRDGTDLRPALACLIGIGLALALMFATEYWTSTEYPPIKALAKSCKTGHATNIIEGLALGYESAVWAAVIVVVALVGAVLLFAGTSPIFIAYGVAMCGIGMLALTADVLSMDVFGPVADNANGIGEMGYNRDAQNQPLPADATEYIPPEEYKRARQILTDLDATGNTTKAVTKGIAIGSAVIAAVSLFASFVAVLVKGREDLINQLTASEFASKASQLTVANPVVFVGMILGAAVPFLFSSMTIRAVGRAAFLIVNECRKQFADREIWAGTKRPDYGRVVGICTAAAQRELIGPGLLAIFTPVLVGFLLGPFALGGFLAGMIVAGLLLAVFMANAGGAWDNAKKMIEDQKFSKELNEGKGSDAHKASVTGDTVGDPLKDTAGPAINPLIKVMNMVSLLVLPLVISSNVADGANKAVGAVVAAVAAGMVALAWWRSKQEPAEMRQAAAEGEPATTATQVEVGEPVSGS